MADVTVTASGVIKGAGASVETGIAGAAITAGQVLYKDAADGNALKLADADSATAAARQPVGIALNGAAAGQPVTYIKAGDVALGGTPLIKGEIYVVSGTAGAIAPAGDLTTGDYTAILGIAKTTGTLTVHIFAPDIVI